ncbi:MAG TPA: alpha-L-arabinofuranosidase C-terminal domain-containing protein [Terracidiphilus sp.]|nr:alpha-L-arabinofuranosidase C-terminal domain-containing protein [Terracidiphilus sp.]
MQRRSFLQAGLLAGSAALLTRGRSLAATADAHIEILLDEPIGTIAPGIYGHFTEHLGGVIYDGVWVGEGSSIPNIHGVRKDLVDKLRAIKAPVIRWPGGCFADSYDWRDGVGPRDKRPRRTNFWVDDPDAKRLSGNAVQLYETNAFGTDEFVRFCRLSGAEPYFAANVRSLTPLDFDHWVEYCNSPAGSTALAGLRAAGGSAEPFNVRYWGVGNESWGCGGNFYPEDYATEFRRFTTWVPSYGVDLAFIGSGPNGNDLDWTRGFFHKLMGDRPDFDNHLFGWSCHYYTWNLSRGKTEDWVAGKGDALAFDAVDWYELFSQGMMMEQIVNDQWAVLGEFDPHHRVKLVIDEYGPWYRPGSAVDPTHMLGQQITMRDAVHTALTLDIFNRHADKVGMAACAQLVNCLNALFLTHEDKFAITPNYHVFDLYAAHQGAQAVHAEFSAPEIQYQRDGKPARFTGLNGSASVAGKTLTLTVTNPSIDAPRETEILVRGGTAVSATARILSAPDVHAHNTFDHEGVSAPRSASLQVNNGIVTAQFPPASVASITVKLA